MFTNLKASASQNIKGYIYRKQPIILTYHNVLTNEHDFTVSCHINPDLFEQHIKYLSNNFMCASLTKLLNNQRENDFQPYTVAVTFDDGFFSNLSVALPILEHYNVPATVFVTTSFINRKILNWPEILYAALSLSSNTSINYNGKTLSLVTSAEKHSVYQCITKSFKLYSLEKCTEIINQLLNKLSVTKNIIYSSYLYNEIRMLSWEELQILNNSDIITIGSHTVDHSRLAKCSTHDAKTNIADSKQILEKKLGTINYFAYPYGGRQTDYTDEHVAMVKNVGYKAAYSCDSRPLLPEDNIFDLPRSLIDASTSFDKFKYLLKGGIAHQKNQQL